MRSAGRETMREQITTHLFILGERALLTAARVRGAPGAAVGGDALFKHPT
jgi:hypothetical protein